MYDEQYYTEAIATISFRFKRKHPHKYYAPICLSEALHPGTHIKKPEESKLTKEERIKYFSSFLKQYHEEYIKWRKYER